MTKCRTCGITYDPYGDGFDGECPSCADKSCETEEAITIADVDRLLGLADQFMKDWETDEPTDPDCIERRKEWDAIRPMILARFELHDELVRALEALLNGTLLDEVGNRNDDGLNDFGERRIPHVLHIIRWQAIARDALANVKAKS